MEVKLKIKKSNPKIHDGYQILIISIGFPINLEKDDVFKAVSDTVFKYQAELGNDGWLLKSYADTEYLSDDSTYVFQDFEFRKELG